MTNATEYVQAIQEKLHQKDQGQEEFLQAIDEFMPTVMSFLDTHPEYIEKNILELLTEPERVIQFRVPWQDDEGNWRVNRGTVSNTTQLSALIKVDCASILVSI